MMQELNYIRCGDYYIPDIRLPEENRPIGRWGRMHRDYIKEHNPIRINDLCLSGELWTYLADMNEQAQNRLDVYKRQARDDARESAARHVTRYPHAAHEHRGQYLRDVYKRQPFSRTPPRPPRSRAGGSYPHGRSRPPKCR